MQVMPLVSGETGVASNAGCGTSQEDTFLNWMDEHGGSYMGWAWDAWSNCDALISNYNGTPTSPWGTDFRAPLTSHQ